MRHLFVTTSADRQSGFSLIEMMVAMVAGLIVMAAVLAFLMASFKSNAENVQSTRLTQELRNTLDLASRDLQRAGYDDDALAYIGNSNVSPFAPMCVTTAPAPTICLPETQAIGDAVGSCVIYAYDRTYPNGGAAAAGTAGAIDVANGEVRGLRRVVPSGQTVGVIEYARSSGTTKPACAGATANYNAFPPTCNSTSKWCPLSDPGKIDITALNIENNVSVLTGSGNQTGIRRIDMTITGQLTGGSSEFSRSVRTSVKVRSQCLRTTGAYTACNASP